MLNLFNTNYQYFYAFLYGSLIKIVDDLIDFGSKSSDLIINLRYIFQTILVIITIYILFFNKNLGIYLALLFILGGIIGTLFAPNIIKDRIWIILISLAIIKLIIDIHKIIDYIKNITKNNIYDIIILLAPLIIICTVFALVEDKLIPEEFSNKKILSRSFQIIVIILFIKYYKNIMEIANIKGDYTFIPYVIYPHLGYFMTSVIILLSIKLDLIKIQAD